MRNCLQVRPSLQIQASKSKCPSPSLQVSGWELQWFFHVDLFSRNNDFDTLNSDLKHFCIYYSCIIYYGRGNNVWREIWDWRKITFLWVIDFIWLKELFFYALYANKFRDLKASNGLAHIFFINCATQASFVQKNGWWNISSSRYSSACLYALKCTNWLPLAFKPLNFRVLKWKRKTLSITFVLVQAKRNHTFMNCQVKSILTFFIFCHLTVWYFF